MYVLKINENTKLIDPLTRDEVNEDLILLLTGRQAWLIKSYTYKQASKVNQILRASLVYLK